MFPPLSPGTPCGASPSLQDGPSGRPPPEHPPPGSGPPGGRGRLRSRRARLGSRRRSPDAGVPRVRPTRPGRAGRASRRDRGPSRGGRADLDRRGPRRAVRAVRAGRPLGAAVGHDLVPAPWLRPRGVGGPGGGVALRGGQCGHDRLRRRGAGVAGRRAGPGPVPEPRRVSGDPRRSSRRAGGALRRGGRQSPTSVRGRDLAGARPGPGRPRPVPPRRRRAAAGRPGAAVLRGGLPGPRRRDAGPGPGPAGPGPAADRVARRGGGVGPGRRGGQLRRGAADPRRGAGRRRVAGRSSHQRGGARAPRHRVAVAAARDGPQVRPHVQYRGAPDGRLSRVPVRLLAGGPSGVDAGPVPVGVGGDPGAGGVGSVRADREHVGGGRTATCRPGSPWSVSSCTASGSISTSSGSRPGVWLPDTFGFSGALPQILRQAGVEWFLSQKLSWNQYNQLPHHSFWWEGIDGSRVFTHFPPSDTYSGTATARELLDSVARFKDHARRPPLPVPVRARRRRRRPGRRDARVVATSPPRRGAARCRPRGSSGVLRRRGEGIRPVAGLGRGVVPRAAPRHLHDPRRREARQPPRRGDPPRRGAVVERRAPDRRRVPPGAARGGVEDPAPAPVPRHHPRLRDPLGLRRRGPRPRPGPRRRGRDRRRRDRRAGRRGRH